MVTKEENNISPIPDIIRLTDGEKKKKKKMEQKQKHCVKVYIWQRTCKGAENQLWKTKHKYKALNEEWPAVISFIYEVESVF